MFWMHSQHMIWMHSQHMIWMHSQHMILWRTYDNLGKTLVFCENFMSTETFTL